MPLFEEIKIGDFAEKETLIDDNYINAHVELTGDTNPLHIDDYYSSKSFFKKRVAHGLIAAGLVGALLGTKLPGPGTIYLSQTLNFLGPVYPGDVVKARVEVLEKDDIKGRFRMLTEAFGNAGKKLLEGEAWVLFRPALNL